RNANSQLTEALNAALSWAVTDTLTLTPKIFYQNINFGAWNYQWRNLSDPGNGQFISGFQYGTPSVDRFTLPSLKIEWALPNATLFSNTSYMDRTHYGTSDYTFFITELLTGNFTGPNAPAQDFQQYPQTQFTQELRLQSRDAGGAVTWVAGAFYQKVTQEANQ